MIDSVETFEAVSTPAGDLVGNGRLVKFLINRRNPVAPRLFFVNGNYTVHGETPDEARYHYFFGREVFAVSEGLQEFNDVTYFTADKRYVAGTVHSYLLAGQVIHAIQFYPQDVIAEDALLEAIDTVSAALTIPAARIAFVAMGAQQTTATIADRLAERGVQNLTLDRVLGSIDYLPLNLGEAWGRLRVFPRDHDELTPTDIAVFEELPLDLSVVAGVITEAVQDTNSHVNLKSKERGTPNAVLRGAGPDHPRLRPFTDQPVHLVIGRADFSIEPSTDEAVAAALAARLDRPLTVLGWEPETELRSYDEMVVDGPAAARGYARRYGSKAANLALLAHRDVLGRADDGDSPSADRGYDLTPRGFAVGLQAYSDFLHHPPNADIAALVDALVADEQAGRLSAQQRGERAEEVQLAFLAGSFPPGALERVRAKLEQTLPGVKSIKVRSSANAEDVPNFDGAGLHDSYAADTGKRDRPIGPTLIEASTDSAGAVQRKVKPKSIGSAIKAVYASLWNKRAIEERSFARIDQTTVAMGLAIVGAYDSESEVVANAVVVTRVLNTSDVYGYSVSTQVGNNLVTNPAPGSYSEMTIAGFISDREPISLTVTRYARPAAGAPERSTPVLPRQQLVEIVELAKRVERAYCRAERGYYRDCRHVTAAADKATALDLELKVLANGRLVVKQVREFGGH